LGVRTDSTGAYGGAVLIEAPAVPRRPRRAWRVGREARLAYAVLAPTVLVILFLVAYPFFAAIYLSLQNKMVGAPGRFVGLSNYAELFRDEVFLRTAWNSVVYTVVAVALKFVIGLTMALILDQERRYNKTSRPSPTSSRSSRSTSSPSRRASRRARSSTPPSPTSRCRTSSPPPSRRATPPT
jgi:hypothetical protein